MQLKEYIYIALMSLCILNVFVLTFMSSKNQVKRIKKEITEEQFIERKNDLTKKNILTLAILIILTILSYF